MEICCTEGTFKSGRLKIIIKIIIIRRRVKLSVGCANYAGILVSIFVTLNFVLECLLKVGLLMMTSWFDRLKKSWPACGAKVTG